MEGNALEWNGMEWNEMECVGMASNSVDVSVTTSNRMAGIE